jgi:hypothetical protein
VHYPGSKARAQKVAMPAPLPPEPADQRLMLYGVTWEQYQALRTALDDKPGLRMTYLVGVLELMKPAGGTST